MRVLFLGEGPIHESARYLTAILKWSGIHFDHQPDQKSIPKNWYGRTYHVIVLSDYRYSSFTSSDRRWLLKNVKEGTGLLMIGGWASFTGLVGGYAGTDIEQALPVTCRKSDDRINKSALLVDSSKAPSKRPVIVCGYHQATPKPGTQTEMTFRDFLYKGTQLKLGAQKPALVRGRCGLARTAAFLTDCAPHWAGGLIDWGNKRVHVKVARRVDVELGQRYLSFFRDLICSLQLR